MRYLALALPLLLVIAWHSIDHSYPRNDAGSYFKWTHEIFIGFGDGITRGLSALYLERGYKPILHPAVAAATLALAGGRVPLAISLFCVLLYGVFVYLVFRLQRRSLSDAPLVFATLFVVMQHWALRSALEFGSELPLLVAGVAAFDYLMRPDFLKSRRTSLLAGLWLGLAICVRPVESILVFGPLVVFLMASSKGRRAIGWRDLATTSLLLIITGAAFIYQTMSCRSMYCDERQLSPYLVLLIPVLVVATARRKLKLAPAYQFFFLTALGVVIAWYAPSITRVADWVRGTTIGSLAQATGMRAGRGLSSFLGNIFWLIYGFPFLVLIACALFSLKRVGRKALIIPGLLSLSLLPIGIGIFTYNGDVRYYILCSLLLLLGVVPLAVHRAAPLYGIRIALLVVITVLQTWVAGHLALDEAPGRLRRYIRTQGPGIPPIVAAPAPDPVVAAIERFKGHIPADLPRPPRLEICLLQMRQYNDLDWVYDPWALTARARELGLPWHFSRPFPHQYSSTKERLQKAVGEQCHYVMVLPIKFEQAPIEHFMSDVGELVLARWKSGTAIGGGLQPMLKLPYAGRDGKEGELLLLRNTKL